MDTFWKWLMTANARGVCSGMILCMIAVMLFWGARSLVPVDARTVMGVSMPPAVDARPLGLVGLLDAMAAGRGAGPVANPFRPPRTDPGRSPDRPPLPVPQLSPNPQPDPGQPQPTPPEVRVQPPDRPPRGPRTISLTYRGSFTRPDGVTLALVEDSQTGQSVFYADAIAAAGMRIAGMTTTNLTLTDAHGRQTVLPLGSAAVFQGDAHVE